MRYMKTAVTPKKKTIILPLRLFGQELALLEQYHAETGLPKTYIIRRSLNYALQKFINGSSNILTLKERK